MTLRRLSAAALSLVLGSLTLVGCGSTQNAASPAATHDHASHAVTASATAATYPRTVTLDGHQLTIPKKIERLVALSPDVADVAMSLLGSDRIVAVPTLNRRPEQSVNAANAAKVPNALETTGSIDPEKVLALNPDLVMLTTRHGAEQDALKQLTNAGVPVLAVENEWDSPDVYVKNVTAIAQAMGVEDAGKKLTDSYTQRYNKVLAQVKDVKDRPTVGLVRILGSNTWINGPGTIGHRIVNDAGAVSMADTLGLKTGVKLDNEQLVKVNPSALIVVDSNGQGKAQYDKLLKDPALASVDAIQHDRIGVITSADIASGTGGITAFEKIAAFLHPELVK